MSTVKIIDFETPERIEHVVFGDQLVPLTPESIHALSLNAQLLAIGDGGRAARDRETSVAPA